MTPEQVSALSDDELNRAMLTSYMTYWQSDKDILKMVRSGKINYLTDYNITMPLVIKHEIGMDIDRGIWGAYHESEWSYSENYLRAACECLVLIAMEVKK